MGTQGLVTVVDANECVLMKVVTGMNGYMTKELAKTITRYWPLDAEEVYDIALGLGFGNKEDLVVMTKDQVVHHCAEELDPRYRDTFDQMRFNPRWEHGTADCTAIIIVK